MAWWLGGHDRGTRASKPAMLSNGIDRLVLELTSPSISISDILYGNSGKSHIKVQF